MSKAQELFSQVEGALNYQKELVSTYQVGRGALDLFSSQMDAAIKSPYSRLVENQLSDAKKNLERARDEWKNGKPEYRGTSQEVQEQVKTITTTISSAETHERNKKLALRGIIVGLVGSLVGSSVYFNRKRKPAKEEALKQLDKVEKEIGKMSAALTTFERAHDLLIKDSSIGKTKVEYTGLYKEWAGQAYEALSRMGRLYGVAFETLEQSRKLIDGSLWISIQNLFSKVNYDKVYKSTTIQEIPISADLAQKGLTRANQSQFTSYLTDTDPAEEMVFQTLPEIIHNFGDAEQTAKTYLNQLEESIRILGSAPDTFADTEKALREKFNRPTPLSLITLEDIENHVVAPGKESIGKGFEWKDKGDIATGSLHAQKAINLGDQALQLVNLCIQLEESQILPAKLNQDFLSQKNIDVLWIDNSLEECRIAVQDLVQRLPSKVFPEDLSAIEKMISSFAGNVAQAEKIQKNIANKLEKNIPDLDEKIEETRTWLAEELHLDPSAVLCEADSDPSKITRAAEKNIPSIRQALSDGDVKTAATLYAEVAQAFQRAQQITVDSRQAVITIQKFREATSEDRENVDQSLSSYSEKLQDLAVRYSSEALTLTSQTTRGSSEANTDIADNIEEAKTSLETALENLRQMTKLYQVGSVIAASTAHSSAQGEIAFAKNRLSEIDAQEDLLSELERKNGETLEAAKLQIQELTEKLDNHSVTHPTQLLLPAREIKFQELQRAHTNPELPYSPSKLQERITVFTNSLDVIEKKIQKDEQEYQQANTAIISWGKLLQTVQETINEYNKLKLGNTTDAEALIRDFVSSQNQLPHLKERYRIPHSDWEVIKQTANQYEERLKALHTSLKDEFQIGRNALANYEAAKAISDSAARWQRGYGITIQDIDTSDLTLAQNELGSGDFTAANRYSAQVQQEAGSAIEDADNRYDEAKRIADAAEQLAREERARELAAQQAEAAKEAAREAEANQVVDDDYGASDTSSQVVDDSY